jgi:hypothetical protein
MQIFLGGQNHLDAEGLKRFAGLPGSKIGIYQIQISNPYVQTRAFAVDRQIYGNFRLTAAVISNDDNYSV